MCQHTYPCLDTFYKHSRHYGQFILVKTFSFSILRSAAEMIKGYSGVAQELQHCSQLRAQQGCHYADRSGAEGDGPALLPCHTPQREVADKDSARSFTLKNM